MQPRPANLSEHFEVHDSCALSQITGCGTLDQAVEAVTRAITAARSQGIKRLLVDASQLTGFPSPSLGERYFISRGWVTAAGGQVELALVLQQHLIDPDRFGIMVATNLGMRANVFNSKSDALAWLLERQS
jgi:hypothetical protein